MCLGATDKSSYTCIVIFPEMDNSVYWRANPLFHLSNKMSRSLFLPVRLFNNIVMQRYVFYVAGLSKTNIFLVCVCIDCKTCH